MTRIVTTDYRYKRPPRKRKTAPLADPAVVTNRAGKPKPEPTAVTAPPPANDDRKARGDAGDRHHPAEGQASVDVPDLTLEEHRRRGDAVAAAWRRNSGKELDG